MTAPLFPLVKIQPDSALSFNYAPHRHLPTTLSITNTSDEAILYKVRTNNPNNYLVSPVSGCLRAGQEVLVDIIMQPIESEAQIQSFHDKFHVNVVPYPDDPSHLIINYQKILQAYWKTIPAYRMQIFRLPATLNLLSESIANETNKDGLNTEEVGTKEELVGYNQSSDFKDSDPFSQSEDSENTEKATKATRSGSESQSDLSIDKESPAIRDTTEEEEDLNASEKVASLEDRVRVLLSEFQVLYQENEGLNIKIVQQENLVKDMINERLATQKDLKKIKNEIFWEGMSTKVKNVASFNLRHLVVVALLGLIIGGLIKF